MNHPPRIPYPAAMTERFRELRGSMRGRRLFLLGTGPSAGARDLTRLRDEVVITVNHFGQHPRIDDIRPDYHVVVDPAAFDPEDMRPFFDETLENLAFLDRNPTRLVIPFDFSGALHDHPKYRSWDPLMFRYEGDPSLPIDFTRRVPTWGQNILDVCLMFCLHLRPDQVFLLGFDNGGVVKRFGQTPHFYESRPIEKAAQAYYTDDELERCMYNHLRQLHALREKAIEAGMAIFTCASEAAFKMFPVVDYDTVLADASRRRHALPSQCFGGGTTPARTVHGRVLAQCARRADQPVLHVLERQAWRTLTGTEFSAEVSRWRDALRGIAAPGERILFVKRTDADLAAGFIGAMATGCVPAQLAPPTSKVSPGEWRQRVANALKLTSARLLVADEDTLASLEGIEPGLRVLTAMRLAELSPKTEAEAGEDDPERPAFAQFSSGSTGLQKGVLVPHRAVLAHMSAYAPAIGLAREDAIASWLPLYHDMGLVAGFLMPLMEGVPLVLMDPFSWIARPASLGEAAERFGATICFLPNFAYHVLAEKGRGPGIARFRLFVNCSEPARPETHERFLDALPEVAPERLSVCYAMAENTFAVSQTPPGSAPRTIVRGERRLLSCGSPVEGTEVAILDADAQGIGEIAIRGPHLAASFLDGVDRMRDGFYPTGDLGLLDAGEIFVAGRKKDLVIVSGRNVFPQDAEFAASRCAGVHAGRVVCFGVDDSARGTEGLVVLFEPEDGAEVDAVAVAVSRAVEAETGAVPSTVRSVPSMSLVKTSSGKISRSRNRELFLSGRIGSEHPC